MSLFGKKTYIIEYSYHQKIYNLFLAFIFVVWPFGALLFSLLTFNQRFSRIIFILFWGVWGYSRNLIWEHDSTDWTLEFLFFSDLKFNEFIFSHVLTFGIGSTDFLFDLFSFGLSRITQSTAIFWFIQGLLFSFLYVKCYPSFLKNHYSKKIGLFVLFIIFVLFIPRTAYGIRFWYAALIYIYSIIRIILYDEKKYRVLLLLTPLIHFSFMILVFSYIYFELSKKNERLFLIIWFTFSFCIKMIGPSNLMWLVENLPIFGQKIESYGDVQRRGEYYAEKSLFFMLDKFLYVFYSIFIVLLFRIKRTLNVNYFLKAFNHYLMVLFGVLILMSDFYDVLDRFSIIFTLLTILYFTHIYVFNKNSILITKLAFFSILFWGIHLIVNYLRSSSSMNSTLWYNSLWGLISGNQELPIIY